MKPSPVWTLALFPILLSGCALERISVANEAQTSLVGARKDKILSCAGTPDRQRREDGWEYLTYTRFAAPEGTEFDKYAPSDVKKFDDSPRDNAALKIALDKQRYCEATFVLKNDQVAQVNYAGNTGGLFTRREQCAYIVRPCVEE